MCTRVCVVQYSREPRLSSNQQRKVRQTEWRNGAHDENHLYHLVLLLKSGIIISNIFWYLKVVVKASEDTFLSLREVDLQPCWAEAKRRLEQVYPSCFTSQHDTSREFTCQTLYCFPPLRGGKSWVRWAGANVHGNANRVTSVLLAQHIKSLEKIKLRIPKSLSPGWQYAVLNYLYSIKLLFLFSSLVY